MTYHNVIIECISLFDETHGAKVVGFTVVDNMLSFNVKIDNDCNPSKFFGKDVLGFYDSSNKCALVYMNEAFGSKYCAVFNIQQAY